MINLKTKKNQEQQNIEVQIEYPELNQTVKRLVQAVRAVDNRVKCKLDQKEVWLNASGIYYIESIDKKTFVYAEKEVYRCELRLYQLAEQLSASGFVQISKSCLLNMNYLEELRTLANSRLEATLTNGERVNVGRRYLNDIRNRLEGMNEYEQV